MGPDAGAALRARAISLYADACEAGEADSCLFPIGAYLWGTDVPRDLHRVVRLREKLCEDGDEVACSQVGWAYRYGRSAPKDVARAIRILERVCSDGSPRPRTCDELAVLYEAGLEVGRDDSKARQFRQLSRVAWLASKANQSEQADAGTLGTLQVRGGTLCEESAPEAASASCPQRETALDRFLLFGLEDVGFCRMLQPATPGTSVSRLRVDAAKDGGLTWRVLEGTRSSAQLERCVRATLAGWPAESWPSAVSRDGGSRVYEFVVIGSDGG